MHMVEVVADESIATPLANGDGWGEVSQATRREFVGWLNGLRDGMGWVAVGDRENREGARHYTNSNRAFISSVYFP